MKYVFYAEMVGKDYFFHRNLPTKQLVKLILRNIKRNEKV